MNNQKLDVRRGREHWTGIVEEFVRSGLTQRQFCTTRGVKFSAFRNWLYQLRESGQVHPGRKKESGGFVEIVAATPKQAVMCKLQFGRTELVFSELPPPEYVGALLRLMDR